MTWLYSLFLVKGTCLCLAYPDSRLPRVARHFLERHQERFKDMLDKDFNGVRTTKYNETKLIRRDKESTTKHTSCLQQGSKGTTKRHKTQEITALL